MRTDQEQNSILWEMIRSKGDITVNYHRNADTGVLANPAKHCKQKALNAILAQLRSAGEATCERLETLTGISHQTCSARISELLRDWKIEICGRGITKSGKPARLYKIRVVGYFEFYDRKAMESSE